MSDGSKGVGVLAGAVERATKSVKEFNGDCANTVIAANDLIVLIRAAALLVDIHSSADAGDVDGFDVEWMVKADELIVGENDD